MSDLVGRKNTVDNGAELETETEYHAQNEHPGSMMEPMFTATDLAEDNIHKGLEKVWCNEDIQYRWHTRKFSK